MKKPPKPVAPPEPNYSINKAVWMKGKTVASVEIGHRRKISSEVHQSELIVIHFTDGTSLSIDTGSNAQNVCHQVANYIKPEEFCTDFMLEWFSHNNAEEAAKLNDL
jgi:hypothetical protein